jgi:hypothetical protein
MSFEDNKPDASSLIFSIFVERSLTLFAKTIAEFSIEEKYFLIISIFSSCLLKLILEPSELLNPSLRLIKISFVVFKSFSDKFLISSIIT